MATRLLRSVGAATLLLAMLLAGEAAAVDPDPALVRRGEYLARAGDCVACHTAPGGRPMAGGLALPTPLGQIVATNITPSHSHGIGNYTLAQFSGALRRGVRADGARLYPAMPYTAYALVTDDDTRALYAYFMLAVAAVDAAPALRTELPFPFNIRLSMAAWNLLFLDSRPFVADPTKSADVNRGAYLARGLAHWGPAIRHAEAVDNSLAYLDEADLRAIALYLKQVPPQRDGADTRPVYAWGGPSDELNSIRGVAWPADRNRLTGPQLYDAHCASCHHARAQGSAGGGLPPLFHTTTLGRSNTSNLVMVMLDGIARRADASDVLMPGFRKVLSDQQVATLGTYLSHRYGNPAGTVTAAQVAALRAGGEPSSLAAVVRVAMVVGAALVLLALFIIARRRPRRRSAST
jgi:mono/diheme cytochrome c family protein